jgi:hypothetical protein
MIAAGERRDASPSLSGSVSTVARAEATAAAAANTMAEARAALAGAGADASSQEDVSLTEAAAARSRAQQHASDQPAQQHELQPGVQQGLASGRVLHDVKASIVTNATSTYSTLHSQSSSSGSLNKDDI